ncbi:MAG TPA: hypothetical protein PK014_05655 [Thermoanaerobaculia bacterium]|nr:hypothetical protein [Thermoanaerobaculia bacterium]HXK67232.1 hypothetical protein [Thermoanaerobaculia bacterium]
MGWSNDDNIVIINPILIAKLGNASVLILPEHHAFIEPSRELTVYLSGSAGIGINDQGLTCG